MNYIKTTSLVAVSVVATLAVASIFGFQISSITAEEDEDKGYKFGEDVTITGVFKFREGNELVLFEIFNQKSGWERADPFMFEVQKITGETPLLHKHADYSQTFRSSELQRNNNHVFDVEILLSNGGDLKRVFSYTDCYIDTYFVETLHDKEEGWMGKGFVVLDNYEIQCRGYVPHNPVYDEMMSTKEDQKAHTESSLDLKEPLLTWSEHFKYTGKY